MAIISEVYFSKIDKDWDSRTIEYDADQKAKILSNNNENDIYILPPDNPLIERVCVYIYAYIVSKIQLLLLEAGLRGNHPDESSRVWVFQSNRLYSIRFLIQKLDLSN